MNIALIVHVIVSRVSVYYICCVYTEILSVFMMLLLADTPSGWEEMKNSVVTCSMTWQKTKWRDCEI